LSWISTTITKGLWFILLLAVSSRSAVRLPCSRLNVIKGQKLTNQNLGFGRSQHLVGVEKSQSGLAGDHSMSGSCFCHMFIVLEFSMVGVWSQVRGKEKVYKFRCTKLSPGYHN
jgi:hypothetical protein